MANGYHARSDARVKTNVCDLTYSTDTLLALRPVSFNKNRSPAKSIGLIAQEVEKLIPELVGHSENFVQDITTEYASDRVQFDDCQRITLERNGLQIQEGDQLQLCHFHPTDLNEPETEPRCVTISNVSEQTFTFTDTEYVPGRSIFVIGRRVSDFRAIDYIGLIPILINSIKDLHSQILSLTVQVQELAAASVNAVNKSFGSLHAV
jgi:hypothetical protein